jgi:hypothetical protein
MAGKVIARDLNLKSNLLSYLFITSITSHQKKEKKSNRIRLNYYDHIIN